MIHLTFAYKDLLEQAIARGRIVTARTHKGKFTQTRQPVHLWKKRHRTDRPHAKGQGRLRALIDNPDGNAGESTLWDIFADSAGFKTGTEWYDAFRFLNPRWKPTQAVYFIEIDQIEEQPLKQADDANG